MRAKPLRGAQHTQPKEGVNKEEDAEKGGPAFRVPGVMVKGEPGRQLYARNVEQPDPLLGP